MLKSIIDISLAEKSSSSLLFDITVKVLQWFCLNAWADLMGCVPVMLGR